MRRYNNIHRPDCVDIQGEYTFITVYDTQNNKETFTIDTKDLDLVTKYKWCVKKSKTKNYIHTRVNGRKTTVHQLLMGTHDCLVVDHINRNTMDNRRENLRWVTRSFNNTNQEIRRDNKYGCRNVTYHKSKSKYAVVISLDGKNKHIGYYSTLDTARRYANMARRMYYGPLINIF